MWLRDACRDEDHVVLEAGERKLLATPVGPLSYVDPNLLRATNAKWDDDNNHNNHDLVVTWNTNHHNNDDNTNNDSNKIRSSRFSKEFLKRYAPVVAQRVTNDDKCTTTATTTTSSSTTWSTAYDIPKWLEPYTGYPDAPPPSNYETWEHVGNEGEHFARFDHAEVLKNPNTLLKLHHTLLQGTGVAFIENVPPTDNADQLTYFIQQALGGLQKDPTREEANWKIVRKADAASSISYDPVKRLYQHTDSSIPPHGIPALVLSMHYVQGYGANTLTDGYAVANQMKQNDPDAYNLLCQYGYDGERDFAASRVDSTQQIAKGLIIPRKHPIFVTNINKNNNNNNNDNNDNSIVRLQYNEVFRMPLTLPFDIFPAWFQAFSKFVTLIHEQEVTVPMKGNTILLMNNWRVLHGRAGNRASPDRHVVGGTIVREAMYSQAMQLARAAAAAAKEEAEKEAKAKTKAL